MKTSMSPSSTRVTSPTCSSFTPIKKALHQTFEMLQDIHGKHSGVTGVPSGFIDLDNYTGGFQNSDLIIIAGRPSQGKTALALSLARNAALSKEKKTATPTRKK